MDIALGLALGPRDYSGRAPRRLAEVGEMSGETGGAVDGEVDDEVGGIGRKRSHADAA